jgi:hypothetical protein
LAATEPGARARLDRLSGTGTPAGTPDPALATALAAAKGADGFGYLDIWAMLRPTLGALAADAGQAPMLGMLNAMPGLATLKLPIVMSYRGGDALDAELRVPLSTLENAAAVVRPFLGGGPGKPNGP